MELNNSEDKNLKAKKRTKSLWILSSVIIIIPVIILSPIFGITSKNSNFFIFLLIIPVVFFLILILGTVELTTNYSVNHKKHSNSWNIRQVILFLLLCLMFVGPKLRLLIIVIILLCLIYLVFFNKNKSNYVDNSDLPSKYDPKHMLDNDIKS